VPNLSGEIQFIRRTTPMHKAWTPGLPLLLRAGKLVDAGILRLIQQSRHTDANYALIKQQVCALLDINRAAMLNEASRRSRCNSTRHPTSKSRSRTRTRVR
jgi:hypothetical protein